MYIVPRHDRRVTHSDSRSRRLTGWWDWTETEPACKHGQMETDNGMVGLIDLRVVHGLTGCLSGPLDAVILFEGAIWPRLEWSAGHVFCTVSRSLRTCVLLL